MFATLQQSFAAALLDPERAVQFPQKRFAVYRNNVAVGLVNALATRFPATQKVVGEEFFRAMARLFAAAHPPRSPLLMQYGDDFPDFIARFEPAADLLYLADVARLEAARTRAYHAADAALLDANALLSLADSAFGDRCLAPHPAAVIVRSEYPIVTIWAMNAGERPLAPIEDWRGEDALVTRPALDVLVRTLPPGGAAFLMALFAGATLGAAAESALTENQSFDIVANLTGLIASGAASGILLRRRGKRKP